MSTEQKEGQEKMSTYSVTLNGPAPWGFRLQGGKDFSMPLTVSRLTPGGKAEQAGVGVGDSVVSICDSNAEEMTHVEAQNKIRAATDSLSLALTRAFHPIVPEPKDKLAPASSLPKYSFAPSTAINKMARPFASGGNHAQTGPAIRPVAYAPKFQPAARAPASVLQPHNGVETLIAPMYPDTKYGLRADPPAHHFIPNDRSKKRLIEDTQDWHPRTGTTQSRSFRILAQLTGTDFMQDPDDENMKRAREKFLTEIQSPRYARLRDWHHDRSARSLNIKS